MTETVTDSAIAERRGLKARQGPTALTAIITVTGPAPITFETADFEVDVAAPTVYLTSYAYYTDTITDYVAATDVETTTVYETVTADPYVLFRESYLCSISNTNSKNLTGRLPQSPCRPRPYHLQQ